MRFSRGMRVEDPAEVEAYLERIGRMQRKGKWSGMDISEPPADDGKEDRLRGKCEKWLEDHGYPYFHDRSRKKNQAGWFDLTCLLPEGRTVYIETKSKEGRYRKEQADLRRMAKFLKHEVYEVRSFKHFLQIMENSP